MSLQSGLETLEDIGRIGITVEAATRLRQALDQHLPDDQLANAIEQCPVCLVLVLQMASASFYRGHHTISGLPMALGLLGAPTVRCLLQGLLLALPRRTTGYGEQELRDRLDQAAQRILPVCPKGNPALVHTALCLFRLVPLLVPGGSGPNRLPEWRQWGNLLLERLGQDTLPPALTQLLARLAGNGAEVEDGDLSANLALLQLILPVALGQGLRHCDPETWRMLELPSRLLQTLSVGESDRG